VRTMEQRLDAPTIVSVNVAVPRTVQWQGRPVRSAIWKEPVDGPTAVAGVNLAGDDQADRRVHGGPDKAVYAYAVEDYEWWAATAGPLAPGTFGENLTTRGIDLSAAQIGDRWSVGTVELEVCQPRTPCFKLGMRMGDVDFPGRFAAAGRAGAYLRILVPGELCRGDVIHVRAAEPGGVPLGALAAERPTDDILRQVAEDPRVPVGWRRSAARALAS